MKILIAIALILITGVCLLALLAFRDRHAIRLEWKRLAALQPARPAAFSLDMVTDLPEPARRYFAFAVQPGTPLLPVAEIDMTGQFSLGTRDNPNYMRMIARQILAAPHGFVWTMRGSGRMRIAGSDAAGWTRFGIFWVVPVARLEGGADHARAAFGRYIAEAAFWTPAALLPGPGITWDRVDRDTARVTVIHGALEQAVDVTVDPDGRPIKVSFQRWSNANPEKVYRLQPFGGFLSDFKNVGGYRIPFRVEAGNMFGTDEYFPFFIADVTKVRFPTATPS